jgi:stress response protein YsnF
VEVVAEAADRVTRLAAAAPEAAGQVARRAAASPFADLFLAPWMGAMQAFQAPAARGLAKAEEVIPLAEEVLEVGKRTENRGTARIHRYVVETPVERQVTLQSERVVVERRRPVEDKVTGEVLTEVTVEVVETEEVPVVRKGVRLREEVVVRTERTQRVETVRETVRRDEVDIQQPRSRRGQQRLRAVDAER